MATLLRSVRVLQTVRRSYSLSIHSSFSASSSPSSNPKRDSKVLTAGPADVADDIADEDDLLLNDSPPTAVNKDAMPSLLQPRVVVYDGVCHLCHKGVKWVIKADKYRKIKFCCLQSNAAEPYMRLSGVEREDVLRRFLFIEGPGLYHQGSTAALRVLSYLPAPYSALSFLLMVPMPLRDAVYDYIANHRYDWFGKDDDCLVLQEKELLERFIDREELLDRSGPEIF